MIAEVLRGDVAPDPSLPRHVGFAKGSSVLDAGNQSVIAEAVAFLKTEPGEPLVAIEGHATPDEGSPAVVAELAKARAEAVRKSFVALGVAAARLRTAAYAAERPALPNDAETARAFNRRVELRLCAPEQPCP